MDLVSFVRSFKNSLGGLNDAELSAYLSGCSINDDYFDFLAFSEGFASFTAPNQNLSKWYKENGWPSEEKHRLANAIARKYGLEEFEPIDETDIAVRDGSHHFEFFRGSETQAIVHPKYVKIRVPKKVTVEDRLLAEFRRFYE